jgi:hypothetical protein
MKAEVADRIRGLAAAMARGATLSGFDPVEVLAALAANERYFRKQFDEGLQAVADQIAARVVELVEAAAPGGALRPGAHGALRFEEDPTPTSWAADAQRRGPKN